MNDQTKKERWKFKDGFDEKLNQYYVICDECKEKIPTIKDTGKENYEIALKHLQDAHGVKDDFDAIKPIHFE